MHKGGVPPPPVISDSDGQIFTHTHSNGSPPRLYQLWKGSNRFFLGGRLIFGPDFRSLFLTISLIVVPVILFCAFVSQRIVNEFPHHMGRVLVVFPVAFTAYIIFLLFLTSGRDPGIIPRNSHPPEPDDDLSWMSISWIGSQTGGPYLPPPVKEVIVNGMIIRVKYCQTCMLYRPPRCSHCSICNNCVERFDHHCPWVGQCIGKRNYRFFFMFIFSITFLCLYVFGFCWVNIRGIMFAYQCSLWKAFLKSPVSGILILYTFIVSWFVGGLTSFHLYLICSNQTTYENFRYRYDGKRNPYDVGCAGNFKEIFLSKIPHSRNNFRAQVDLESPSVSNSLSSHGRGTSQKNFDMEMEKQRPVDIEESGEIQVQIDSNGELERCRTQVRPASCESQSVIPTGTEKSLEGKEKTDGDH
ncbi:probable protein S-acyltransferase 7 [Diospyros lotus]|uniref:probable protein S-acyltransferase 7 n=1 Tax=Diospyros lotus TaxID=55363 RepID=UPI00224CF8B8|nr:probable protein S-acyltransferase 7 [Diospyros lotus]